MTARRTTPLPTRPRAERSVPRAGWMVVARKEFADHLLSARFIVLLLLLGVLAAIPLYLDRRHRSAPRPRAPAAARRSSSRCSGTRRRSAATRSTLPSVAGFLGARRAAARAGLRVRRRQRRALAGHAAAPAVPADPPRRRHQRQVRGRAWRSSAWSSPRSSDSSPPFGCPPARRRPGAGRAPSDHPVGARSRSSTWRSGSPSGCSCRWSCGGRRRRRSIGFGAWLPLTFFGGLITSLIGGFFAPLTGSNEEILRNNALQETLSRLAPGHPLPRGIARPAEPPGRPTSRRRPRSAATSRRSSGSRRSCRSTRASSSSGRRSSRSSR